MLQNRDTGAFAAVSVLQHPPLSPSRRQLHVGTFTRASGWEEWDGRTGGLADAGVALWCARRRTRACAWLGLAKRGG